MADNTTTYTAVVDMEVKGKDEMKDLGDQAEETGGQFVKMQLQIRQTQKALQEAAAAGDTVKFNKLRAQLDDLEDGLEKVQFQSKQFEDQLATMPGPAGAAGNAIKGVGDSFKLMLANPVVAVIAAIVGVFLLLKKSLESTAEGQKTLNRISEAFGKLLGPIMALIESVAVPIFNALATVIEKVAGAFSYFVEKLGISKSKIAEASSGIKDFAKANEDAAKAAKDAADKAAEDAKKKAEEAKKKAEEAKRVAEEARKKAEEEKQKRIEAAKSAIEFASKEQSAAENLANARKKHFDDRIEEIKNEQVEADSAYKIEVDRINNLLKVQGLAEKERRQLLIDRTNAEAKYLEDKKTKEVQIIDEENKRIEQKKKDDEKAAEDKKKKDEEDAKKKEEDAQKLADAESQARSDKAARIMAEYDLQQTVAAQSFQSQIDTFDKVRELERTDMVAKMASADALAAFDAETAKVRVDIERAATETKLGIISNALNTVAEAVGRNTIAGKALAVAQATIDTYLGATKALATYPPPFGAIAAGTVILAGLLNVRKIISTQIPTMGGVSGGSSGGGASMATPSITAPSVSSPGAPQLQGGGGVNPTSQIAQSLAQSSGKPIQAYVVSTQMSSQQALDRRTTSAATF
jgi:hypothetical protein